MSTPNSNLDVELSYHAQEIVRALAGRLPTWMELKAIQDERGYEVAATVLYKALLHAQPHATFIRNTQLTKPGFHNHSEGYSPVEVCVLPSVMPGGTWGAHTGFSCKIARELGFTTDDVPTLENESLSGNAWRIGEYLKRTQAERIIMLTTGRGSAELRMYLQRKGLSAEAKKIRGWLNINGCTQGSALIENEFAQIGSRLKLKLLSAFNQKSYAARAELAAIMPGWNEKFTTHHQLMTISVFGILLPHQVPNGFNEPFEIMKKWGPTDGKLLAKEMMMRPGFLYPVPGLPHHFTEFQIQSHLQRLLTVMGHAILQSENKKATQQEQPNL